MKIRVVPATPERWADLAALFGKNGACAGCWCMWFRQRSTEFREKRGDSNRRALRRLVGRERPPGLLAYAGDEAVGWCSLAPRQEFVRLSTSRILKPVDEKPVWSVVCFFVARQWRRQGVSVALITEALKFARRHGARIVEGYPVDTRGKEQPDVWVYHGLEPAFRKAGFREIARRSRSRPILRRSVPR